ncbi:MAG: right-handed parallel beta-helix repeat-containing protein [Pseudomonadota bacterium]
MKASNRHRYLVLVLFILTLSACGGGGGGGGGSDTTQYTGTGGDGPYTISVATTGLSGTGLQVNLKTDAGTEPMSITSNGTRSFDTKVEKGQGYSVEIASTPTGHVCEFSGSSSDSSISSNVTVDIVCNIVGISPKVSSEYLSSGEDVVVTLNGTEDMTVLGSDWRPKAFNTEIPVGQTYKVTLKTPPDGMDCNLFDAFGTIEDGTVPEIKVDCYLDTAPLYTIGGSITGLNGDLVIIFDDSYTMNISAGATSYTSPMGFPAGRYHDVRVLTNPTGQICSVENGYYRYLSADITDVNIICSPGPYEIGGYVDGLTGTGLSLVLNDTEVLPVPSAGPFAFDTTFRDNMTYQVEVAGQPVGQECTVTNGYSSVSGESVDNVFVNCTDLSYQVKVETSGYSSSTPLELSLNNESNLSVYENTGYYSDPVPFSKELEDGESYEVQVVRQPEGQVCTLSNASGTINGADAIDVVATCTGDAADVGPFTVGVTVSGLEGEGLILQLNGSDDLEITENGYQTFATTLADTDAYEVTVAAQPGTPLQYCAVKGGSGNIASANITDVGIVCGNGVQPLYSNAASWLGFVENDGVDEYSASNAYCSSDDAATQAGCLHGGEYRTILLQHLNSCENVSATDDLGLFDWTCIDSNGIRLVTSGLKAGKYMSDMMDFTGIGFKPNFVTVFDGATYDSTSPAIWWNNKVIQNNTGANLKSGTVHLITDSIARRYYMGERTALIMKPGTTLFAPSGNTYSSATVHTGSYVFDFLWFEGNIQGNQVANTEGIGWSRGHASVISNTTVEGMSGVGIEVSGSHLKMIDVNSSNNGRGIIIYGGSNSTFQNLTVSKNIGSGIRTNVYGSTFKNVVANDNADGTGIELGYVNNATISNLTANNNATGIEILGAGSDYEPVTIDGLTANGNAGIGVTVGGVGKGSNIANIAAHNNGDDGAHIGLYDSSVAENVATTFNGGDGLYINGSRAKYINIRTANNGASGVSSTYNYGNTIQGATSTNNAGAGFNFIKTGGLIAENILATNNAGSGIQYNMNVTSGFDPGVFMNVTSANNVGDGFLIHGGHATQLSSILLVNNGGSGFVTGLVDGYTEDFVINNMLSANNSGFGIELHSDNDYFTGLLEVGTNAGGDCSVDPGTTQYPTTNAGLTQGGSGKNPTYVCGISGLSDATLIDGIDASSTVVAEVFDDDTANSDDVSGAALFDNITDWSSFEHAYRVWGADGPTAFADAGNQGACNTQGSDCRIWDWSISTADLGDAGTVPASYDVLALPGGNDTLTIDWDGFSPDSQEYCDTNFPGSTWDGVTCISTYLRNATEISGDGIGNDNALCESGETCLYTPNIGAYQGHGALVNAGTFTNGELTGITLMKHESLGR